MAKIIDLGLFFFTDSAGKEVHGTLPFKTDQRNTTEIMCIWKQERQNLGI
jgi:hypothetical protein